jgi:hypothetical protein
VRLQEAFTWSIGKGLSLRLYPDNRPRNLEIATLQKGLVLVANGGELIEEGAGFGVPIAKYADCTYFCGSAQTYLHAQKEGEVLLSKVFYLDAVSRKQVRGAYVNEGLYSVLHKAFEKPYLHKQSSRSVFDWIMHLRKSLGVRTRFVKAVSRGKVTVTYHCLPGKVEVYVALSELNKIGCQEVLLLNEQGAGTFRKYSDSSGAALLNRQIGAWTRVAAKQATFSDVQGNVSFSLEKLVGAALYRGREQVKDRFSWAGITYALQPQTSSFTYTLRIAGNEMTRKLQADQSANS